MPAFRCAHLHLWLSILLMVALAAVGRADQTPDPASAGKGLQLHQAAQFVLSAPALDIKTGARKAASSWNVCADCAPQRDLELRSVLISARPAEEASGRMPLWDLRALRGRAPPRELFP